MVIVMARQTSATIRCALEGSRGRSGGAKPRCWRVFVNVTCSWGLGVCLGVVANLHAQHHESVRMAREHGYAAEVSSRMSPRALQFWFECLLRTSWSFLSRCLSRSLIRFSRCSIALHCTWTLSLTS